jgi:hypothetical protein
LQEHEVEEMRAWIVNTLIGPNKYFAPTGFESTTSLYHTALPGSFVLSVIDGVSPAPFRVPGGRSAYNELVRVVQRVSDDEQAFWFYVTDPDNAFSMLEWVQPCNYDHALDHRLESFERSPAIEGGRSLLGLAGASRRWLLLHEYEQSESFEISVYGPSEFCRAIAAGVGLAI